MSGAFYMREYPCPSGCKVKFDSSANAIHHAQQFHGYDRNAIERITGLSHYDKELWDILPLQNHRQPAAPVGKDGSHE